MSTQETVNLLLTGKGTSNVFDGTKVTAYLRGNTQSRRLFPSGRWLDFSPFAQRLDETAVFRGVDQRALIGFLSRFEFYGHMQASCVLPNR